MKYAPLVSCIIVSSVVAISVGPRAATPLQMKSSGGNNNLTCDGYLDGTPCQGCPTTDYTSVNSSNPGEIYVVGNGNVPMCQGGNGCVQITPAGYNPNCTN
jgi:hypothetical protein